MNDYTDFMERKLMADQCLKDNNEYFCNKLMRRILRYECQKNKEEDEVLRKIDCNRTRFDLRICSYYWGMDDCKKMVDDYVNQN